MSCNVKNRSAVVERFHTWAWGRGFDPREPDVVGLIPVSLRSCVWSPWAWGRGFDPREPEVVGLIPVSLRSWGWSPWAWGRGFDPREPEVVGLIPVSLRSWVWSPWAWGRAFYPRKPEVVGLIPDRVIPETSWQWYQMRPYLALSMKGYVWPLSLLKPRSENEMHAIRTERATWKPVKHRQTYDFPTSRPV